MNRIVALLHMLAAGAHAAAEAAVPPHHAGVNRGPDHRRPARPGGGSRAGWVPPHHGPHFLQSLLAVLCSCVPASASSVIWPFRRVAPHSVASLCCTGSGKRPAEVTNSAAKDDEKTHEDKVEQPALPCDTSWRARHCLAILIYQLHISIIYQLWHGSQSWQHDTAPAVQGSMHGTDEGTVSDGPAMAPATPEVMSQLPSDCSSDCSAKTEDEVRLRIACSGTHGLRPRLHLCSYAWDSPDRCSGLPSALVPCIQWRTR